ncbi:MAG: GNAT family protein, partial [Candidatus Thorarchaeota archaeon]
FINPIPGFKCAMSLNLLDKKIWGKEFIRAGRKLIEMYMDEFSLKRISTQTADPKIVRMAKMVGFKEEGERPLSFMFNQKLYPTYLLGLIKEEK